MGAELNIAVRTLVEYVHQGGDLTAEFIGAARSQAGIRGHQSVQRSRPETYTPEVSVSRRLAIDRFVLNISGRIDGIFRTEHGVIIDEIKTTTRDPESFGQHRNPIHWAQAKAYAYLYAAEHGLGDLKVQLTYYQLGTGVTAESREAFTFKELEKFFMDLLRQYLRWAETLADWMEIRDGSIRDLAFPFPDYRLGQRKMAVAVYHTIREKSQLILQAATGIGKTMAALFPAIKAVAEGMNPKIFYLTARTTGRTAAEQALDELRGKGLRFKSVTLTAKDKICFRPDSLCDPEECAFAKGHFDRVGEALRAAFTQDALTREIIEKIAADYSVCPFEFSLALALWADGIICDYNYAFDPRIYLRRFFLDSTEDFTFLIDEAHNLVDRSREMFSAEIRKQPFLDMRRAVKSHLPDLYRCMGKINAHLVKIRKACSAQNGVLTEPDPPDGLYPLLRRFLGTADRWLSLNIRTDFRSPLLDLYFSVSAFMRVSEQFDHTYAVCQQQDGRDLRVKLFCMDPSKQMKEAMKRCRASIFFSATLTPASYFRRILGCDAGVRQLNISSPFPARNLGLIVADTVSTLYRHREQTAGRVAGTLHTLVDRHPGNYLFYFPSYAYLDMVHSHFRAKADGAAGADPDHLQIVVQTPEMSETDREAFIEGFAGDRSETLVGFAVMGGIFGEGIDLVGDRLTGAAVIGVGLPGISPERELIRRHFAAIDGTGFEFAYLFPGINRVLQAAGRVIRSGSDTGVVLLVDHRYASRRYASLLPPVWRPVRVRNPDGLSDALKHFWSGHSDAKRPAPAGSHAMDTP